MITKDFTLPTEEDLTVQEINISTPALRAAAFHVGKEYGSKVNAQSYIEVGKSTPNRKGHDNVCSCITAVVSNILCAIQDYARVHLARKKKRSPKCISEGKGPDARFP
ncbi:uncharacterized protein LOC119570807 [Penaeus monodon]|uniref:uncharacterized protein LOC119570807 n=1 Tax=Penaeus monodon TaxID=6687 RepID=UPI0018A78A25|nr:uncharacterized protein LOC119570807 [Penaeus monodon]